jgi:two-component system, OmpR family, sensor histidine kinase SenX3
VTSLGQELVGNADAIVQRWYDTWRESSHPHDDVAEAALKDKLPQQLRLIGEQLEELGRVDASAEKTDEMWRISGRLDPEERVEQDVPIEDVVQQYRIVVDTVRTWIEERGIDVPFLEYSYFYSAIFELAAESVRRYARHEAQRIREDRAAYLAGVMHQLRTPVSVLATGVEVLDRAGREALAATVPRLRRNVRRINVLVESILRLERYEPGDIPVHPESIRPAHLIDEIISDYEAEALRKGLRFEAHVDRSLHMTVDPNLLMDSLGNLVHNAVRYTRHGYVIIDAEEHRNHVVFCVRDSGPGMSPQKLRSLFRDTQPGSAGGAGIGLRVAQHAAHAQGGTIDVRSETGRGSVFTLRLPRVAASDEPHPHDVS